MSATPRAAIIPVTPFQQNCTLIWDDATKVGAVVDPGGDLDRIESAIRSQGVKVEKILLTHGHIDHAGGAAELKERLGVPVEFGTFAPAVGRDYTASTTADVISSAGAAVLSVSDQSGNAPGRLVNGTFALATPLQARDDGAFAPVGAGN